MRKDALYREKQSGYKLTEDCLQEDGSFDPRIKKYLLAAMIMITVVYLALKIYFMPRF